MKRIFSVLLGAILSIQIACAGMPTAYSAGGPEPKQYFTVTPSELTMTEGETARLTVTVDPEYADVAAVTMRSMNHKALISDDGTVTSYQCGEESIAVYVSVPDDSSETGQRGYSQSVKIQIQPDETLPTEIRTELDRLQTKAPIEDFQRRTLELLGILDENAPRITAKQVDEILSSGLSPKEMIEKMDEIHGAPDYIWSSDPGGVSYWLDDRGNDCINISGGSMVIRSKVYDDGTGKEMTVLYPSDSDIEPMTGPMDTADTVYIFYNKLPNDRRNPVKGDANSDGSFNLADIVRMKKWLLAVPGVTLSGWKNVDINEDGKWNAADLTLMKRELLEHPVVKTE